jgi:hypothetical protein
MGPNIDIDLARYDKTFEVNLRGALVWTQQAFHRSMKDRGGTVINVASVGGLTVEPSIGIYNVTKAALIHLTRTLAAELAPTVRVNAIAPGLVKTDMARALWEPNEEAIARRMPLHRLGEPEDIGPLVVDHRPHIDRGRWCDCRDGPLTDSGCRAAFEDAVRRGGEAEALVELVGVSRVEQPLEVSVRPVSHRCGDEFTAESLASVPLDHEDVGQIRVDRAIADDSGEADLGLPSVDADDTGAPCDAPFDDVAGSAFRPVGVLAEKGADSVEVDAGAVIVDLVVVEPRRRLGHRET